MDRQNIDNSSPHLEKTGLSPQDVSPAATLNSSKENQVSPDAKVGTPETRYEYLTFDSTLPAPNPTTVDPSNPPQPPPPDLSGLGDPKQWPLSQKWAAALTSSFGCLIVAYSSASYAFAVEDLAHDFQLSTNVANIGITAYNIGFGVIPMLCAPLSESIGRYPVFTASGVLFVIANLCCGVTTTYAGMVVARFLAGCGGSTFSTIIGGIVSDVFVAEGRNTPMAVFSSTTLTGVGLGLVVSGAIAQDLSWRWIFYVQTILSAVPILVVIVFLRETRGSVVLRRRAKVLNKWYAELEKLGYIGVAAPQGSSTDTGSKQEYAVLRWKVESDEKRPSMLTLIGVSLVRPFKMLFTEPVVFFFSLWATFTWSILYLTFESVPLVFTTSHNFNDRQNGLVFLAMMIATALIALPVCIVQDNMTRNSPKFRASPESRLFFVCFMSAFVPIGLFWFGWTQFTWIPWIVPVLAIGCLSIGIFFVYLAVFNYFADVYGLYASSAMAASSFCRNIVSGVFPFFSNTMFERLTFQGAASLLGGIGVVLMVAPVLLLFNGPKIRAMSKFSGK